MNDLLSQFPEAIRQIDIGKTYEGKSIPAYMIALYQEPDTWYDISKDRPAMLLNGAHHAREMSSMSMCVYTMMSLLSDYAKRDLSTMHLLKSTAIFVVPVVNFDGYVYISDHYKETGVLSYLRKNRHVTGQQNQ